MINLQWLKLPMSRTNLHGRVDVRVIEVRPCIDRKLASFDIPTRDNIHQYQCDNPILLYSVYLVVLIDYGELIH